MTPAQQTALEALAGRGLTADEVAQLDLLLPERNDVEIAAVLSMGRTQIVSTQIGIGDILAVLAPSGGDFLDGLEALGATDRNVYWSMRLIERGVFDIGMPAARAQVLALAGSAPDLAAGIAALLALAEQPAPIHFNTVSDALNLAEGRLTL